MSWFGARPFCSLSPSVWFVLCCPEPPEYEARDISVRVMSPQSVLISWVDPAVEMGKVDPEVSRWESKEICLTIECVCLKGKSEFK